MTRIPSSSSLRLVETRPHSPVATVHAPHAQLDGDFVSISKSELRPASPAHVASSEHLLRGIREAKSAEARVHLRGAGDLSSAGIERAVHEYGAAAVYSARKLAIGELSRALDVAHAHLCDLERRKTDLERLLVSARREPLARSSGHIDDAVADAEAGRPLGPRAVHALETAVEGLRTQMVLAQSYIDTNAPALGRLRDESQLAKAYRGARKAAIAAAPYVAAASERLGAAAGHIGKAIGEGAGEFTAPSRNRPEG